jgi:hypothetical protein
MDWEPVFYCTLKPTEWNLIPPPGNKDRSIGTGLERILDHAGKELTELAKSETEVAFWIRGDVALLKENGGLRTQRQPGKHPVELKAKIEGVLEKCIHVKNESNGTYEWLIAYPILKPHQKAEGAAQ